MSTRSSLPLLNRTRRRRRRSHCHHWTVENRCRRPDWRGSSRSDHAHANRFGRNHVAYRRGCNFSLIHSHHVLRHWTRIHERIMRHHRHTIRALVHVRHVVDRRTPVYDHRVVNVRHPRHAHVRIGDVDIVHVPAADAVSGQINFSRSQREPPHTNARREMESRSAAHKRHQSRRPHWPHYDRSRDPVPPRSHKSPASVVERRKSPGLVFHPRPAPRPDINPVAEAIRGPYDCYCARTPARPVTCHIVPIAVLVEILVARHLARNIISRVGAIFTIVALKRPFVQSIASRKLRDIVIQPVASRECSRLAGNHRISVAATDGSSATMPHSRDTLISILAYVDAIFARLQ